MNKMRLLAAGGLLFLAVTNCQADIVIDGLPKSAKSMLDLRIKQISLNGLRMQSALTEISHAIETSSRGTVHLSYGLDPAEQYTPKGRSMPQYHLFRMHDPKVSIDDRDTTLRQVFDKLCMQARWSYKLIEGRLIFFTDDTRYFEAQTPR